MRFIRLFYAVGFAVLCVLAPAQMSRWQLGNPSLILDFPGDPHGGGVKWSAGLSVLPTSWSSETDDLRVEVAEEYGSAPLSEMAPKMGGSAEKAAALTISGYAGTRFEISGRLGMRIQAPGRVWYILASPKTSKGVQLAHEVLNSIVVERSGEKRWVQRSLGRTRMNAELPFELAHDSFTSTDRRSAYELHFDDFSVTASVASAEEGAKVDFAKTVSTTIENEKARGGTTDFKSSREKIKRDQLEGELITMEFTRGRKYKLVTFFAMDNGRLLRMNMTGRGDRPGHDDYIERITSSLRVSTVTFDGFEPRQVGNEGIWLDLPKNIEKIDASNYNCFAGPFQINVRVTPVSPSTGSNPDQLIDFLDVKFKATPNARNYKSERSETMINGMEARILRAGYKGKDRKDQTMLYGLAIFLPDRIVVAEMISEEQQKAYLERIIDTARVELAAPSGWTRQMAGDTGLSILAKSFKPERVKDGATDKVEIDVTEAGLIAHITEMKFTDSTAPAQVAMHLHGVLEKSMKATGKIISQQPIEIGNHSGVRLIVEYELDLGRLLGDVIVLRKGQTYWALAVGANAANADAVLKKAILVNSIQ